MGHIRGWLVRTEEKSSLFGKIIIGAFVLANVLDGVLTYFGVMRWGLEAEANPIIAGVISLMGVVVGLTVVKLVAVELGTLFYWNGFHNLLVILTIYFMFAVGSWTYLFLTL